MTVDQAIDILRSPAGSYRYATIRAAQDVVLGVLEQLRTELMKDRDVGAVRITREQLYRLEGAENVRMALGTEVKRLRAIEQRARDIADHEDSARADVCRYVLGESS